MRRLLFVLSLALLPGCSSREACSPPPSPEPTVTAPPWSREGLEAQERLEVLRQRTPPELGFDPGTTPWRPARLPVEPGAVDALRAATPGALLALVVERIGWNDGLGGEVWEQTLRVWSGAPGEAVGVVLRWGLQDDAVAGHDLRVHTREGADGWAVTGIEERFHCARGVTAEGLCL